MKKLFGILLAVVLVFSAVFALAACGGGSIYDKIPDDMVSEDGKYQLAVVTDIGSLKDKGFNQGTWEGTKKYASDNGMSYKYYQPANGDNATDADRIAAMELAVKNGAEFIIAPGFLQFNAIYDVSGKNPNVKFIFIDGWDVADRPNVTAVVYQEEQSGYFAGYAAVKEGYTKLGTVLGGGSTNPACNRFGYGYVQGANAAAAELGVQVQINLSFAYGSTFSASTELQTQVAGWYNAGTEVVFACGGSMFASVVAAADATKDGKVIGVDVDQSSASERVITSAVKGLRESVELTLKKNYEDKVWDSQLGGKLLTLGAKDGATGLPTETWSMRKFKLADYEELLAKVIAGTVKIDAGIPKDAPIDQAWINKIDAELTNVSIAFTAA